MTARCEVIGDATPWICEQCLCRFAREKSGARPIRFCSQPCYRAWHSKAQVTGGQFQSGLRPWNAGKKGIHLSPNSEWKKGQPGRNWLPVAAVTTRLDKNAAPRAYRKIAEPNVWRENAIVVWEELNGPLPDGIVIHHRDKNSINDIPSNLQALTRAEHIEIHRDDLTAGKMAA